jgi:predicted transposase/invertase (TIGR01784 family)
MKEKYINLFTDFGFKKLFGEEDSKEQLIAFLNTLLPTKHHIKELSYTNNEKLGTTPADRKAIFDLHCTSTSGERFIVELQLLQRTQHLLCYLPHSRTSRKRRLGF